MWSHRIVSLCFVSAGVLFSGTVCTRKDETNCEIPYFLSFAPVSVSGEICGMHMAVCQESTGRTDGADQGRRNARASQQVVIAGMCFWNRWWLTSFWKTERERAVCAHTQTENIWPTDRGQAQGVGGWGCSHNSTFPGLKARLLSLWLSSFFYHHHKSRKDMPLGLKGTPSVPVVKRTHTLRQNDGHLSEWILQMHTDTAFARLL